MTAELIYSMGTALLLTIVIEGIFGLAFGVRSVRGQLIMLLANLLTNPLVNAVHGFCAYGLGLHGAAMSVIILALEAGAFAAEGYVYSIRTDIKRPFLFSFGANAFSYTTGVLIGLIF